jgi:GTPase SAR1 family protein
MSEADRAIDMLNRRFVRIERQLREEDGLSGDKLLRKTIEFALPENPEERDLIFTEFRNRPDGRFKGEILAMLSLLEGEMNEAPESKPWRELLKYPDYVTGDEEETMDRLERIKGILANNDGNKYVLLSDWLRYHLDEGNINSSMHQRLRAVIADNL